jgi:hypothetical protein
MSLSSLFFSFSIYFSAPGIGTFPTLGGVPVSVPIFSSPKMIPPGPIPDPVPPHPWIKDNWGWVAAVILALVALMLVL